MNSKSPITPEQRRTVASCTLARKRNAAVAGETGFSPTTVDHQIRDPRTVTMILVLKEQSRADLARLWKMAIRGLAKGIRSRDQNVRHNARGQFLEYLKAGDQDAQEGD